MRYAYSDGSYDSNNGVYKYGWIEDEGFLYTEVEPVDAFTKPYSSHYAEYLGILSFIPSHMDQPWELRIDSNLVYYQVIGEWTTRSPALIDICRIVRELVAENDIKLTLIKSKENKADKILRGL